jgi:hypothetical protein
VTENTYYTKHNNISVLKGKATHPASASSSALLHPRCRCGCREVPYSTWHNSNVDEEISSRCKTPCIPRFMQGACYKLKTYNVRKVFKIVG